MAATTYTVEEIPERVHDTLVTEFGEGQKERVEGYFYSQSLRKIMEFVDPDDVVSVTSERTVQQSKTEFPLGGSLGPLMRSMNKNAVQVRLDYERQRHGPFPWDDILTWLDGAPDVYDLPVRTFVFRVDDEDLRDHLFTVLNKSTGFTDYGEFRLPFSAVMRSQPASNAAIRKRVTKYHDERYFINGNETDADGNRGLNWSQRTMRLAEFWSLRAWLRSRNVALTVRGRKTKKLTMRDVEELAINCVEADEPVYGAINSKLLYNRWASTFGSTPTDYKRWRWDRRDGWIREK